MIGDGVVGKLQFLKGTAFDGVRKRNYWIDAEAQSLQIDGIWIFDVSFQKLFLENLCVVHWN